MPAGGALTLGVIAAGTLAYGAIKKAKAKKQQAALAANRPKYEINPEEQDIENLAESRANQGMGAGARQQLQNNADRQLSTLSNAALMGGADANGIGNLVDKSANAYSQNAIYDDQVRLQNLNNLQSSWARMSANKDKQWALNTNQPWKDQMASVAGQVQEGDAIMNQGISGLGSAAGGIGKAIGGAGRMSGGGNIGGGAGAAGRGLSPSYSGGGGAGADQLSGGGMGNSSWASGPQGGAGDGSWIPQGPQTYQNGYSPTLNNNSTYSYWGG